MKRPQIREQAEKLIEQLKSSDYSLEHIRRICTEAVRKLGSLKNVKDGSEPAQGSK